MRNEYQVLVLNELFNNNNKSRVDLSKDLHINKTSISTSVSSLIDEGLLREVSVGEASSRGGRKPIKLMLDHEFAYFMAIDLSKNYISFCICNMAFEVKEYGFYEGEVNSDNAIEKITSVINNNKKYYTVDGVNKLKGVTIAIHGIVNDNNIIFTPNYDLDSINLLEILNKKVPNIDFNIINESNAAALCEHYISQVDNLITINVGSGLGAGIIIDGHLYIGKRGYGGEIGHMIIVPNGRKCHCGNEGCFEQYCSSTADISYYNEIADDKIKSSAELIERYKNGDSYAVDTIKRNIYYMSIGVNNMMKTIDPSYVYINSDLAYNIDEYLPMVNEEVKSTFGQDVPIEVSKFHDKSTLIGCIYYGIIDFFEK